MTSNPGQKVKLQMSHSSGEAESEFGEEWSEQGQELSVLEV